MSCGLTAQPSAIFPGAVHTRHRWSTDTHTVTAGVPRHRPRPCCRRRLRAMAPSVERWAAPPARPPARIDAGFPTAHSGNPRSEADGSEVSYMSNDPPVLMPSECLDLGRVLRRFAVRASHGRSRALSSPSLLRAADQPVGAVHSGPLSVDNVAADHQHRYHDLTFLMVALLQKQPDPQLQAVQHNLNALADGWPTSWTTWPWRRLTRPPGHMKERRAAWASRTREHD